MSDGSAPMPAVPANDTAATKRTLEAATSVLDAPIPAVRWTALGTAGIHPKRTFGILQSKNRGLYRASIGLIAAVRAAMVGR
jgi:hypothetical protein